MKKLILFLSLITVYNAVAQVIPDGEFFDVDGNFICGYPEIDYSPSDMTNKVNYTIGDHFSRGYYYNMKGEKVEGYISFTPYTTNFKFKTNESQEKSEKIDTDECKAFGILKDSFTVIKDFQFQNSLGPSTNTKRYFAEVIASIKDKTFLKVVNTSGATYIYRTPSGQLVSFPQGNKKFLEVASLAFSDFPALLEAVKEKKFAYINVPQMVKLYDYKFKYEKGEKIYLNRSWDEASQKNHYYYGIIESLDSLNFKVKYFTKKDEPVYSGTFTSFFPDEKQGEFTWYHSDGTVRKKAMFAKNELRGYIKVYYKNGKMRYAYKESEQGLLFKEIKDPDGKSILDASGNGKETFYDSLGKREVTREYVAGKVKSSYYTDRSGNKIYQVCSKSARLKPGQNLAYMIQEDLDYPVSSAEANNHGTVLVRVLISPVGIMDEMQILKGLDAEIERDVNYFFSKLKVNQWKAAKENKELVYQELLIPITYNLAGFSSYRGYRYPHWQMHNMMRQQQMMHNMQMMQQMRPPTVAPRF